MNNDSHMKVPKKPQTFSNNAKPKIPSVSATFLGSLQYDTLFGNV